MKLNRLLLALGLFLLLTSFASAAVNFRFSPLAIASGTANLELDFELAKSWSLGPSISYLSHEDNDYDVTGYSIGIRGNYYFGRDVFTQGWYLGPSLHYASVEVEENTIFWGTLSGKATGFALGVMAGYQWIWESFNMMLGGGPVYYTIDSVTIESSDGTYEESYEGMDGASLALEFTLGWKF